MLMIVSPGCSPQAVPPPQAEAHPCLVPSAGTRTRDTIVVALSAAEIPPFINRHLSSSATLLDCRFQPIAPPASTFALSGDSLLVPGDSSLPVLRLEAIARQSGNGDGTVIVDHAADPAKGGSPYPGDPKSGGY